MNTNTNVPCHITEEGTKLSITSAPKRLEGSLLVVFLHSFLRDLPDSHVHILKRKKHYHQNEIRIMYFFSKLRGSYLLDVTCSLPPLWANFGMLNIGARLLWTSATWQIDFTKLKLVELHSGEFARIYSPVVKLAMDYMRATIELACLLSTCTFVVGPIRTIRQFSVEQLVYSYGIVTDIKT